MAITKPLDPLASLLKKKTLVEGTKVVDGIERRSVRVAPSPAPSPTPVVPPASETPVVPPASETPVVPPTVPTVPTVPTTPIDPESVVIGELEEESVFGGQYGVSGMPTSIEEVIQQQQEQQKKTLEEQRAQAAEIARIEAQEFEAEKAKGEASKAGVAATFAPTREGLESAGAPMIVSEFKARLDQRIKLAQDRMSLGQRQRQESLRQMEAAQKSENFALVRQLKAKVDNAELEIQKAETDLLNAQERAMVAELNLSKFGLEKQESIRQNYETFTGIIESGGTFTPQGIVGLSKQLEIPFEDAWNFYEGAQSIRDDKKLTAQEKQIALQDKAFELDQKINGIQTEKAKNLDRYQKMKNMGTFTDLELQDIARGLNLDLAGLPENQAKLALDQANAEIKAIEAKYAGKPPPFGTKDYWDIEEKKAQINKVQKELQETTQTDSVLLSVPKDLRSSVTSKASQFDAEPQVKNFQIVQEGLNFVKGIADDTTNPADDIGFIYAFAKIMDPNSVVREGEYATVQKYAQSWASSFGFKASRIFTNTKFLSQDAIKNMRATLQTKLKASEQSYDQIRSQYIKSIDNLAGMKVGERILQDYKIPESQKSPLDTLTEGLKQFPIETQKKAIEAIRNGQMTMDEALEFYEIPFNQVGGDTEEASQEITQASIGSRKVSGQPKLLSALERANQDMIVAGLGGLKVNESFRENARQAQLYANYIEKPYSYGGKTYQPNPKRKGFRAAKPGQSFHGKGLAVDIGNWKEAEPFLRKYGLRNDLKDDKNHFSIGEFTG